MSPITTHVLDLVLGRPAEGLAIVLEQDNDAGAWVELARGATGADGRVTTLLPAGTPLKAGVYRLRFATSAYFSKRGMSCFYPEVQLPFQVHDPAEHYHVPLLLSPYGYSTYRGS